ncbi:hypothetical protein OE88DRAFT_1730227 [Heliocybe sulcata]|uniref:YABBY protein C-terminal domain-containing protein n=1 Tax=Heliocybe sulcata TaxID=5364 RepID=A0A5C3NG94_9AGAM|nr:hypothetical protein OE88DRAFT_1730227 [Heliocybe sulcata]
MASNTEKKPATEKRPKKKSSGGSKKKLSAFNKFMQTEMARLKEEEPDMPHQERFKTATSNWSANKNKGKADK